MMGDNLLGAESRILDLRVLTTERQRVGQVSGTGGTT